MSEFQGQIPDGFKRIKPIESFDSHFIGKPELVKEKLNAAYDVSKPFHSIFENVAKYLAENKQISPYNLVRVFLQQDSPEFDSLANVVSNTRSNNLVREFFAEAAGQVLPLSNPEIEMQKNEWLVHIPQLLSIVCGRNTEFLAECIDQFMLQSTHALVDEPGLLSDERDLAIRKVLNICKFVRPPKEIARRYITETNEDEVLFDNGNIQKFYWG